MARRPDRLVAIDLSVQPSTPRFHGLHMLALPRQLRCLLVFFGSTFGSCTRPTQMPAPLWSSMPCISCCTVLAGWISTHRASRAQSLPSPCSRDAACRRGTSILRLRARLVKDRPMRCPPEDLWSHGSSLCPRRLSCSKIRGTQRTVHGRNAARP